MDSLMVSMAGSTPKREGSISLATATACLWRSLCDQRIVGQIEWPLFRNRLSEVKASEDCLLGYGARPCLFIEGVDMESGQAFNEQRRSPFEFVALC